MKKIFGAKKDKGPPPSIQDATERINKRGETVDEKIKKLDEELARYKEQIRKTRPGPSQEAIKARAIRLLKHKRMYEEQRNMLYNQTYNLDQVAFAADGLKDAQQTMNAMKAANKELKGMMKTVKIEDIDNMQDEMTDLMDVSNEIQETLGRSYNIPDDVDEEELMGELDALESDMEFESAAVPSYLQPETDFDADLNLPAAPTRPAAVPAGGQEDELGLPAVPRASLRRSKVEISLQRYTRFKRSGMGISLPDHTEPSCHFTATLDQHKESSDQKMQAAATAVRFSAVAPVKGRPAVRSVAAVRVVLRRSFRAAAVAVSAAEPAEVDYSSSSSVFPMEACELFGGDACSGQMYPEARLAASAAADAATRRQEEVERDYVSYDEPKTVFPGEACDDLGGEFCEEPYQAGVSRDLAHPEA
ncbi:vacuolar protein sorting-associated protein 60.1 [Setaria italica]|nr:vacuolar protein sorting-associated protein 60.1 [Setaria italica]